MHGNVWELTSDWWGVFTSSDEVDPEGAIKGVNRVNRGGSWNDAQNYIRSSSRLNFTPNINSAEFCETGWVSGCTSKKINAGH